MKPARELLEQPPKQSLVGGSVDGSHDLIPRLFAANPAPVRGFHLLESINSLCTLDDLILGEGGVFLAAAILLRPYDYFLIHYSRRF